MLRYLTAGESHGEALACILEGLPAGLKVSPADIKRELARRRAAPGRSLRQKKETDAFKVLSGMDRGATTGAPVAILIPNAAAGRVAPCWVPRPGHADLPGMLKYGLDAAQVRERASARHTACVSAMGAFALRLLAETGARFSSRVVRLSMTENPSPDEARGLIARAAADGDTLGGVFELTCAGLPAGLGSHVHHDRRLGARLGAALLGINGIKGFETGGGFDLASWKGTLAARDRRVSGGLDGGMTNGGDLVLRCAMKPVPGVEAGVPSFDARTDEPAVSRSATSDVTAVYAAAVVAEHAAALELAAALLEKFGGDTMDEIKERVRVWRKKTAKSARR
ncbi:MAG: chorismate synthase [Elusimicrobiales bacterium]|nr:chorismate synthase [Elusimicrobiales bacterium]